MPKLSFGEWREKEYGSGNVPGFATDDTRDVDKGQGYSFAKGIAGGVQKGLTGIAQIGGNIASMAEDAVFAPLEVVSGQKIGEISDKGPLNRWNDSIDRAAERVEDYYADNIAAGGKGAEFFDKLVEKSVSLVPQVLYTAYTGEGVAVPELAKAAFHELPGTVASIRTVAENLASDPWYWFSAAGTAGEGYRDAMEDDPPEDVAGWRSHMARSAGQGLYKEAVGTSDEVPGVLSTLAEIVYEMYQKRRIDQPSDSVLDCALNGLMKILWD